MSLRWKKNLDSSYLWGLGQGVTEVYERTLWDDVQWLSQMIKEQKTILFNQLNYLVLYNN